MIRQSVRRTLSVALLVMAFTIPMGVLGASTAATLHHQPMPCDPNC
jgi:hypothetical protein